MHLLLAVTLIYLPRYRPLRTTSVYFPYMHFIDIQRSIAHSSQPAVQDAQFANKMRTIKTLSAERSVLGLNIKNKIGHFK